MGSGTIFWYHFLCVSFSAEMRRRAIEYAVILGTRLGTRAWQIVRHCYHDTVSTKTMSSTEFFRSPTEVMRLIGKGIEIVVTRYGKEFFSAVPIFKNK